MAKDLKLKWNAEENLRALIRTSNCKRPIFENKCTSEYRIEDLGEG